MTRMQLWIKKFNKKFRMTFWRDGLKFISAMLVMILPMTLALQSFKTEPNKLAKLGLGGMLAKAETIDLRNWDKILQQARNQKLYFYAWGGSELYNQYIDWAAKEMQRRYGFQVKHVRLTDTALAVNQVLRDKKNNKAVGTVDVIWINGGNFKSMKEYELLFGDFASYLPNYQFLRVQRNPELLRDFTVATDGLEMPWGRAAFVFIYDSAVIANPPKTAKAMLDFAAKHPNQLSYPAPPDFTGMAFLKQLLLDLTANSAELQKPVPQGALGNRAGQEKISAKEQEQAYQKASAITAPLWQYLDQLHPLLWRGGKNFPKNESELLKLFSNRQLLLAFSYNAGLANAVITQHIAPATTRSYGFEKGALSNQHYLAIPYNSNNKESALVFINFLTGVEAQAKKLNPRFWGEPSVLDLTALSRQEQKTLIELSGLNADQINNLLPKKTIGEPHPSWTDFIETEWKKRYYRQ